ncbi:MAG: ribbon-helix-helix domain-containing protein [Deltaproteobacteria bacterium]|nr:ribbon-helix-helix domain-containing protein [Deltaproteobacteria bacterium]
MKKTSERGPGPSAASLRAMPEVDITKYRVRRNPYAMRIAREGVELVHDGPSARSLAEMPEADFARARVRRNPYVSRAAEASTHLQYGKGRPRRGDEVGPTIARSIRLPAAMWAALEAEARQRKSTVHALVRELITTFVVRQMRR